MRACPWGRKSFATGRSRQCWCSVGTGKITQFARWIMGHVLCDTETPATLTGTPNEASHRIAVVFDEDTVTQLMYFTSAMKAQFVLIEQKTAF